MATAKEQYAKQKADSPRIGRWLKKASAKHLPCRSFEDALAEWQKEIEPIVEASRSAERLTAEDFALRINY